MAVPTPLDRCLQPEMPGDLLDFVDDLDSGGAGSDQNAFETESRRRIPARLCSQSPARVEIDNQQVRVIRRYHQPHERVPFHSHREGVIVYLTEVRETSTSPDGTSREVTHHAGDAIWSPAHTHSLENLADTPIEVIEIELKSVPSGSVNSKSRPRAHKLSADTWNAALAK